METDLKRISENSYQHINGIQNGRTNDYWLKHEQEKMGELFLGSYNLVNERYKKFGTETLNGLLKLGLVEGFADLLDRELLENRRKNCRILPQLASGGQYHPATKSISLIPSAISFPGDEDLAEGDNGKGIATHEFIHLYAGKAFYLYPPIDASSPQIGEMKDGLHIAAPFKKTDIKYFNWLNEGITEELTVMLTGVER